MFNFFFNLTVLGVEPKVCACEANILTLSYILSPTVSRFRYFLTFEVISKDNS